MEWLSNKNIIGGLIMVFLVTLFVSQPVAFDNLLSFVGVSVGQPEESSAPDLGSALVSVLPPTKTPPKVRGSTATNSVSKSAIAVSSVSTATDYPSPSILSNTNKPTPSPSVVATSTALATPTHSSSPSVLVTPILTPIPSVTSSSALININTAGLVGLDKITGVGPVIAQRIIDYRQTNGPFKKIEDIKKVKGIGDITFQKMEDEITVSP